MSFRLFKDLVRAAEGNVSAAWREWRWRASVHADSLVVRSLTRLPETRTLYRFQSRTDFLPWMVNTDRDSKAPGTTRIELEYSRSNTMIFRGHVGPDPEGGYDPHGACVIYTDKFNPPLDLEEYDYVVWRMRELPLVALECDLPPLPSNSNTDGSARAVQSESSPQRYNPEDDPVDARVARLRHVFSTQQTPTAQNPHSVSVMSSLLTVPLPLSHATAPFLRPSESQFQYSATGSIYASIAPTSTSEKSTTLTPANPVASSDSSPAASGHPFDPTVPSNHWLYDGREVWLIVETESATRRISSLLEGHRQVHAHPALLPSPELLARSGLTAEHLAAPPSRSDVWLHEHQLAQANPELSDSASTASNPARLPHGAPLPAGAALPADAKDMTGRPFFNVLVPIGPHARSIWPNVISPSRPWQALLSAAVPQTAEGTPIFRDQARYLEFQHNMKSSEVSRLGLAIPYTQPGPFALEVESVSLVRGAAARTVWPSARPLT